MKRAIEVGDIRKGDTIRYEPTQPEVLVAAEYLAERDGQAYLPNSFGHHYLLDRPIPPVELPEVPTLGWATHSRDGQHFGFFNRDITAGTVDCQTPDWGTFSWSHEFVTAFTEAVAVPKDALEVLRAERPAAGCCVGCRSYIAARDFLAAIDEVKG